MEQIKEAIAKVESSDFASLYETFLDENYSDMSFEQKAQESRRVMEFIESLQNE